MRYTIAYPRWDDPAMAGALQAHRRLHDAALVGVVQPHFTLVFQGEELPLHDYVEHVRRVAERHRPIRFACRCTLHSPDSLQPAFRQYLVPDEGLSGLVRLHSELHSGAWASRRRPDLEYLPHVTIGTFAEASACIAQCEHWNAVGTEALGVVEALTVAELREGRIVDLHTLPLGGTA